ncbi:MULTISPECIES: hypothetical protein [Paraburkholderia]|uniref:YggT family protein n=1 Tax=Paraburkholderia podalyriae TaxID=1938811 RepID=A0ABR7PR48_9BURK|nr:hypothetical protein [Paraburkholderia podalyriae]MBC8748734.1 hypothetical protein [Paraburkholderia podalyriae]
MTHARLFRRCVNALGIWLALGTALAWGTQRLSFEIPLWFADFVRWLLRYLYPDWMPDAYDVEAWSNFVLIVSAFIVAAAIVAPVSVIGSRTKRFA